VHKQFLLHLFGMSSVGTRSHGGQGKVMEKDWLQKSFIVPLIQTKIVYKTWLEFFPNMPITEPIVHL